MDLKIAKRESYAIYVFSTFRRFLFCPTTNAAHNRNLFLSVKKKIAEFQVDDIFQSKLSGKKTFSIQKRDSWASIVWVLLEH